MLLGSILPVQSGQTWTQLTLNHSWKSWGCKPASYNTTTSNLPPQWEDYRRWLLVTNRAWNPSRNISRGYPPQSSSVAFEACVPYLERYSCSVRSSLSSSPQPFPLRDPMWHTSSTCSRERPKTGELTSGRTNLTSAHRWSCFQLISAKWLVNDVLCSGSAQHLCFCILGWYPACLPPSPSPPEQRLPWPSKPLGE